MDEMIQAFIANASTIQKGIFLMIVGILFVFVVQVTFYIIVKCWPKKKAGTAE